MSKAMRTYVSLVVLAGAAIVVLSVRPAGHAIAGAPVRFALLGGLLLLAELRPIPVHRRGEVFEVVASTTFAYALVLGLGVGPAVVAHVLACLTGDLLARKSTVKSAFNSSQCAISTAAAGWALTVLPGAHLPLDGRVGVAAIAPILLGAVVYFVTNNVLVWSVVALATGRALRAIIRDDIVFNVATSGVLLALSPLVASVASHDALLTPFLLIPVGAVYTSARVSVEKEDQALHDALTGLPNRVLFNGEAGRELQKSRPRDVVAVGLIDLNGFKDINDTLGHHIGDEVLRAIGARLDELEGVDLVARFGGDEFTFLVTAAHRDEVFAIAEEVVASIAAPLVVQDEMRLEVTASVGIAFYPEHGGDVDTLLQRADVAMYLAKRDRTGYEIYAASRDHNTRRRLSLLADLRSALEREELFVVYQPKLDLATNRVTGVEALVRWRHPDLGFVSPAEFIPLAEHTGVIAPLTAYVLEQAIRECRRWRDEDMPLHVAVNISARLLHDDGIVTLVTELLDRYGVRPDELVLEVTESCIMSDPRRAEAVLNQLHQHGIRLSIDDFGTGYSSLSYLARLPVSEVKIDRSFVTGLERDPQNRSIVRSIIDLARGLDLSVTAEGVESAVVQEILRDLGCDRAQGFLIGRPMHPAALRDGVGQGGAVSAAARPERPLTVLPGGRRTLPAIAR